MNGNTLDNGDRTFEYVVSTGSNKPIQELRFPVNVLKVFDVRELVARVMNFHRIPCFVETELNMKLKKFVDNERMNLHDHQAALLLQKIRDDPTLIEHVAKVVSDKYENSWQEHAPPCLSQSNNFPLAYHHLIHSTAMQNLLQLEKKYHNAVSKFLADKEQSLSNMRERHRMEMSRACDNVGFAYTTEDVSILATKQLADSNRLEKQWKDNYRKLTEKQKQEYCDVVVRFSKEMKENEDKLNENGNIFMEVQKIIDSSSLGIPVSPRDATDERDVVSENSVTASSGISMEESFTINLGAQLKTMHNIRLMVADMLYFCRYSDDGEMEAQRFQTAMSLYSNSLSAIILLSDKNLKQCSGIEKDFRTVCESSTEFHFDSLDEQVARVNEHAMVVRQSRSQTLINTDLNERNSSLEGEQGVLTEGDFYITKHSNLSQVHLVFHLVAEESQLRTKASLTNVTSRHHVILGMRHIMKVASSHDIRTITIPLLLCHELSEEITFQWCVKRAELVMKCVKGFMMEMATWDGGISRTIQFVIPPGVSEEAFDKLRSALPEVFRTTSTRDLTPAHKKLPTR
ncbi:FERRY endosomal RAB5 effector complex subunit 3 [Ciona intestinalis]